MYSFIDDAGKILYVGKAKNLKKRITSYSKYQKLLPRIRQLVTTASEIKFQTLESELEALLVEAELIRAHQPPFNIRLKDDKSPIYIEITQEKFPKLKKRRKQDITLRQPKITIGPFASSYKLNEVLKIARRIFPWCDGQTYKKNLPQQSQSSKACFYYHLDLCPGACTGEINPQQYQSQIDQLLLFLRGKKKNVINSLIAERDQSSANQQYERAAKLNQQIEMIKEVTGKKYRLKPNIVLPAFSRNQTTEGLVHLRKILSDHLQIPKNYVISRVEGYDVSNIQGKDAAVSMIVFTQGQPDSKEYRLFNIYSLATPNDYQMLKEAVLRRQNHPEWAKPNLVVIDGGKGQLRAVLSVWKWPGVVISIAKNPDRIIIPVNIQRYNNRLAISYQVIRLPDNHPALQLIRRIRDESHRFARRQHQRLRTKSFFNN